MPILHEKPAKDYTIIPNELINDLSVPPDAKIILMYLISEFPSWAILRSTIKAEFDIDDYVLARIFQQLEEAGYLKFKTCLNEKDLLVRYGYEVYGRLKYPDFDTANNTFREFESNPVNSPLLWKEFVYLSTNFSHIWAKKEEKDRATREANQEFLRNIDIFQEMEKKKQIEQFKGAGPTTALKLMKPTS